MNGYTGFDFNSDPASWTPGDFHKVKKALQHRGIVAALPTFITDGVPALLARARRYSEFVTNDPALGKMFPLIHIEGPFISQEEGPRGAHPLKHCRIPEEVPGLLPRLQEASGDRIGMFTLAPELEGAIGLIEEAVQAGICISIAHTEAGKETIDRAVEAGAKLATHLGNGSHQMLPRLDNYVQVQLADDRLLASFIADGHHIPFYTLKNFIRAKTPERSILVTDAIAAAEIGPGHYKLGDDEVVVRDDLYVSKPGQPNLAGSALTLDRAIINTARYCDVTFKQAWRMASVLPAELVGLAPLPEITVEIGDDGFVNNDNP